MGKKLEDKPRISRSAYISNYELTNPSIVYLILYFILQEDIHEEQVSVFSFPGSGHQEIMIDRKFMEDFLLPTLPDCDESDMMNSHLKHANRYNHKDRAENKRSVEDISYTTKLIPFIMDMDDPNIIDRLGDTESKDLYDIRENSTNMKTDEYKTRNYEYDPLYSQYDEEDEWERTLLYGY